MKDFKVSNKFIFRNIIKVLAFIVLIFILTSNDTCIAGYTGPIENERNLTDDEKAVVRRAVELLKLTGDIGTLGDKGTLEKNPKNDKLMDDEKKGIRKADLAPGTGAIAIPDNGKIIINSDPDSDIFKYLKLIYGDPKNFKPIEKVEDLREAFPDKNGEGLCQFCKTLELAELLLHENTHNQQTEEKMDGSNKYLQWCNSQWIELEAHYAELLFKLKLQEKVVEKGAAETFGAVIETKIWALVNLVLTRLDTVKDTSGQDISKPVETFDCGTRMIKLYQDYLNDRDEKLEKTNNPDEKKKIIKKCFKDIIEAVEKRKEGAVKRLELLVGIWRGEHLQDKVKPIEKDKGGYIILPDGKAWVYISPYVLPETTTIGIYGFELDENPLTAGRKTLSPVYELRPNDITLCPPYARITIKIDDHQALESANIYQWNNVVPDRWINRWELITEGRTIDSNEGTISIDVENFGVYVAIDGRIASNTVPNDGEMSVPLNPILSWNPGPYVQDFNGHAVYFSTDFNDIKYRNNSVKIVTDTNYFQPPGLSLGTTYYWCVDEVNDIDPCSPWSGESWAFKTVGGQATNPIIDGNDGTAAVMVKLDATLSWSPGPDVGSYTPGENGNGHHVFIDTNYVSVRDSSLTYPLWPNSCHFRSDTNSWSPMNPAFGTGEYLDESSVYYWRIIEKNGDSNWPGPIWVFSTVPLIATNPIPTDDGSLESMKGNSSWLPGKWADPNKNGHGVYFGTDYNDVNDATYLSPEYRGSTNVVGPDPCSGRYSYNTSELENLQVGQKYYWRIDEVNQTIPKTWKGNIWSFTIDYAVTDDFERYTDTGGFSPGLGHPASGTLRNTWIDGFRFSVIHPQAVNGGLAQLNLDTHDGIYDANTVALGGEQSMKFYYDNNGTQNWQYVLYGYTPPSIVCPKYSEAVAAIDDDARQSKSFPLIQESLGLKRDWSSYKLLKISFYGDPANTYTSTDKLYVGLVDGDHLTPIPGIVVVVQNPDPNILKQQGWHDWYVKLSDFQAGGIDLTKVARIAVGVGDRSSPQTGGKGAIFIDDIQILANSVCTPGSVVGDFTGDCIVNNDDLDIMTSQWLGEPPIMPTPIIDLNAASLPLGPFSVWTNNGSSSGKFFDANNADPYNNPVVNDIDGRKAVVFDYNDILIWKTNDGSTIITAPATLTSDQNEPNDFTVIYEVWNPEIDNEEWLLTWAGQGGPTGTHAGFGYGSSSASGCVSHWGTPDMDMGFDHGVPAAYQWHKIGVTYNETSEAVAVDGILHSIEDKDISIRPDEIVTLGAGYLVSCNPNDNWLGDFGYPDFRTRYTGSVASIKVYGVGVKPEDLALLTGSKIDLNKDNKINFKDFAVLANQWLEEFLWP